MIGKLKSMIQNLLSKVEDDPNPNLGGDLNNKGFNFDLEDANADLQGIMGATDSFAFDPSKSGVGIGHITTLGGDFDPNNGGAIYGPGIVDIYGQATVLNGLAGEAEDRIVYITPQGTLYTKIPPVPGWSASDTDNGNYLMPTLGTWVEITGLTADLVQTVNNGDRLDVAVQIHIVNGSSTRGGSVDIGFGDGVGVQPVNSANVRVEGGADNSFPVNVTTTTFSGNAGDTVSIWTRKATQDHNQFNPRSDASSGSLHQLTISTP